MGSRRIPAITSCLIILFGYRIGFAAEEPEIYGQFEKVGPIIRDTVTGLEWQVGPDEETTWNEAKAWVDGLGGDWRMPTRTELQDLWDSGISYGNWGPFENSGWFVWSGEVHDSSSAWGFFFDDGIELLSSRGISYSGEQAFAVLSR